MRLAPLFLLAAACGSNTPPLVTADQFPAAFGKAVCQVQSRCRTEASYLEQQCEADSTALYAPDLAKALKNGRAQFDAPQAQKCLDLLSARPCDDRDAPEIGLACNNAVRGTVLGGEQCNWLYECASGLCAPAQAGACPATCIAPVAENGACPGKNGAQCDDRAGLRCIAGVCSKLHAAGQGCTFDSDCAVALYCNGTSCAPRGNAQASCAADNECSVGLYCQLSSAGGLCRARTAQGASCSGTGECAAGLVCAGYTAVKPPVAGACQPPGDAGGSCAASATVTGCGDGLICASGKCALPPTSGPCAGGTDCLDGTAYCDANGQCQKLKANGAACGESKECQSGACVSGACGELAGACHEP